MTAVLAPSGRAPATRTSWPSTVCSAVKGSHAPTSTLPRLEAELVHRRDGVRHQSTNIPAAVTAPRVGTARRAALGESTRSNSGTGSPRTRLQSAERTITPVGGDERALGRECSNSKAQPSVTPAGQRAPPDVQDGNEGPHRHDGVRGAKCACRHRQLGLGHAHEHDAERSARRAPAASRGEALRRPAAASAALHQRFDQDAVLVGADHGEHGTPPAVLVKVPPDLDPLHGCSTLVARRRGERDHLESGHGVTVGRPCVPGPRASSSVGNPSLATRVIGPARTARDRPCVHLAGVRLPRRARGQLVTADRLRRGLPRRGARRLAA